MYCSSYPHFFHFISWQVVYQKLHRILLANGVRFIAPNRRHFPGSSHFTSEELAVATNGSEEQKDASCGRELAIFIDVFCQTHNIALIDDDGNSGG